MNRTPIEWCDFTVNPIRFRNKETGKVGHYGRLSTPIENSNHVTEPPPFSVDFHCEPPPWPSPVLTRKRRYNPRVLSLDNQEREQGDTEQAGAFSVKANYVLRFPLRVPPPRGRIVQFDRARMKFLLEPLNHFSVRHANRHGRIEGRLSGADMGNSDTTLTINQASDISSFNSREKGDWVWGWIWLSGFCSQIFKVPPFRFRRINLSSWHKYIVAFRRKTGNAAGRLLDGKLWNERPEGWR